MVTAEVEEEEEVKTGGIMAVGVDVEVEADGIMAVVWVAGIGGIVIHGNVMVEEITVVVVAEGVTAIGEEKVTIGVAEIGGTIKVGAVVTAAVAEVVWTGQI